MACLAQPFFTILMGIFSTSILSIAGFLRACQVVWRGILVHWAAPRGREHLALSGPKIDLCGSDVRRRGFQHHTKLQLPSKPIFPVESAVSQAWRPITGFCIFHWADTGPKHNRLCLHLRALRVFQNVHAAGASSGTGPARCPPAAGPETVPRADPGHAATARG